MTTWEDDGLWDEPERLIIPGPTSDQLMKMHNTIPCPLTYGEHCHCEETS